MKNILVVDDEPPILTLVSDALEDDYHVFTAESVFAAEKIIADNPIDLLISDLVIPEKNGIDMIMEFRAKYPHMLILAISGGGGIVGRFDYLPIAKLIGAADTLKKPFTIHDLRKKVQQLMETKS